MLDCTVTFMHEQLQSMFLPRRRHGDHNPFLSIENLAGVRKVGGGIYYVLYTRPSRETTYTKYLLTQPRSSYTTYLHQCLAAPGALLLRRTQTLNVLC
jgi:hypothetical protein